MSVFKSPQELQKELDIRMKKFLEKGGKVEKLKPGNPVYVKYSAFSKEEIANGVGGKAPRPNYDTYKKGSYHDYDVGGDNPPVWYPQPKNPVGGKWFKN